MRVKAVIHADCICGELPARPALTIVKYSSREAETAGASSAMWAIFEFSMTVPLAEATFSPMRMRRSKADVRAFSLVSLQEMTTSDSIPGMK